MNARDDLTTWKPVLDEVRSTRFSGVSLCSRDRCVPGGRSISAGGLVGPGDGASWRREDDALALLAPAPSAIWSQSRIVYVTGGNSTSAPSPSSGLDGSRSSDSRDRRRLRTAWLARAAEAQTPLSASRFGVACDEPSGCGVPHDLRSPAVPRECPAVGGPFVERPPRCCIGCRGSRSLSGLERQRTRSVVRIVRSFRNAPSRPLVGSASSRFFGRPATADA